MVGLNFMWLTAQHVFTRAAGGRYFEAPLWQRSRNESKTSIDSRHSHGKVILLCLSLSAESGLPL